METTDGDAGGDAGGGDTANGLAAIGKEIGPTAYQVRGAVRTNLRVVRVYVRKKTSKTRKCGAHAMNVGTFPSTGSARNVTFDFKNGSVCPSPQFE